MATILVIDDEKGICDLIKTSLELCGHNVHSATNGKDGLALLVKHPVDIVITDIFMPEQDGFETILQLKKASPNIKIIAISGGGYFESGNALIMAHHFGAHYGLNKPLNIFELQEKVEAFLKN